MSKDLVVRFAGEGGQGVVTAAEGLARAAARVGYHVQTFATFPSQIKGGPTWAQARISTEEALTPGDQLDVLVALNRYAYEHYAGDLREDGVLIYNLGEFDLEDVPGAIGIDADALARSTGNPLAVNMVLIGAVAELASMPRDYFSAFIKERFTRGRPGDDRIIEANTQALYLGYEAAAAAGIRAAELDAPGPAESERVLLTGYEALALGAITAGLETFIGYPISPATTTLVYMENNLAGPGRFVGQASSEIEAIGSLVGAGFAGKKAMTSTSGPGLSLMGEGLGLAWMAEIPLVVLDVQRGGPATGLPTKPEQSDLLVALNPGHGDLRLPVIAPGSVEECFRAGAEALNWAERYQGPVILLSDTSLAERTQDTPLPDLDAVHVEQRLVSRGEDGNRRYRGAGLTPFPVPGGPGAYVANGSEHDEQGDTTHLPENHVQMTQRRFSKLRLLETGSFESDVPDADVVLMPWGGSRGPALAAYRQLRAEGVELGWRYTMYLHPLPPALLAELQEKDLVIVPELNYLGQFSSVLRSLGVNAHSITQYTGLPFSEHGLAETVRAQVSEHAGKMTAV